MRTPKRYDCGTHGLLTAAEIARIAGISTKSVHARATSGHKGELLARPAHAPIPGGWEERKTSFRDQETHTNGHTTAYIALRIAAAFTRRVPEVAELMRMFGMSRATAYRWRNAFNDAWGTKMSQKGEHRAWTASTAHATAHEVAALREADKRIAAGEDARTVLLGMIDDRQLRIDLLGGEGGHA